MNDLFRVFDSFYFYEWPEQTKPPMTKEEVKEKNELIGYNICMALAGFKNSDIEVEAEGREVFIKGSNLNNKEVPERFKTDFSHTLRLSEKLDPTNAKVSLENGLLTIFIPVNKKKTNRFPLFGSR